MNRQSKIWLAAAGAVAVTATALVLLFGVTFAPDFPSLYDGGPTIEASVAYIDYGRQECVLVLDVATGESQEVFCDDWLWLEGWDRDGNLRVQSEDGRDRVSVIDPDTGLVVATGDLPGELPPYARGLSTSSDSGHATLTYRTVGSETTLIDVDGPRSYSFIDYGFAGDGSYAWVCDSEDRLITVALDGSAGPWLVAEGIHEPAWRQAK